MALRRQLVSQSGIIFVARLFGAGLIFLAQAAITRIWGAEALGEYLLIIATTNIVSVILPLGFETIGTYFAAEYRVKGEGRLLRGFMWRAYGHIVALIAVMVLAGPLLAGMLGAPGQVLLAHWGPLCIMTFGNALVLGLKSGKLAGVIEAAERGEARPRQAGAINPVEGETIEGQDGLRPFRAVPCGERAHFGGHVADPAHHRAQCEPE